MSANLPPPETTWSFDEAVIRRFEAAWREPVRPDLEAFVSPEFPDRQRLLAELTHVDLEFRLRAGEPARVEDYLSRFPELAARSILLELVATEFAVRNRYSDPVRPEAYFERVPEYRNELADVLSLDAVTETRTPERRLSPLQPVGSPVIPGLEILGVLGRGGMGVVYQALQPALNRVVAVKTLAASPGTAASDRFRREAETVARLDHPNIVPVYEVGAWTAGGVTVPYFVMKYYPGGSLDARPCGPGTDPADHARVVEVVARAVHHAHERGVLHRDLKPSNILLDEAGQPHVADFGLAGCFDAGEAVSVSGTVVGTPAYMAPEQARGNDRTSLTADVYGLGAILYQRLTGHPPFLAATPLATLELVTTADPVRPSALNPRVSRDLETICLKCLQKDPARRYLSSAELAEELHRLRTGRPILARPTPTWEHAWRWARRNPVAAMLAGLTLLSIAAAIVILAVSNARVARKETETATALVKTREAVRKLTATLEREREELYLERVSSAGRMYGRNQLTQCWNLLDLCPDHLRSWEWRYLDRLRQGETAPMGSHTEWVVAVEFLSNGRLATADAIGEVRIWDAGRREQLRAWRGKSGVTTLSAHPERPWLAVADPVSVVVWNSETGAEVYRVPGGADFSRFSPDGTLLAVAVGPVIRFLDTLTWEPVCELVGHQGKILHGTFHPQADQFASCGIDRTIRTWSLTTARELGPRRLRPTPVRRLAYALNGSVLFEEHLEGIAMTRVPGGEFQGFIEHSSNRSGLAIGPTVRMVVISGPSNEILIWDHLVRSVIRTLRGHTGPPTSLAVSRDGRWLASSGGDRTIRIWDLTTRPEYEVLPPTWPENMSGLAVAPGGSRLALSPRPVGKFVQNGVRIFDRDSKRELFRLDGTGGVVFTSDGRRIVVGQRGGGVGVFDAATGKAIWSQTGDGREVTRVAVSRDGRRVATGNTGGTIRVWDAETGQPTAHWSLGRSPVYTLAFTRDGEQVIAASQDCCTMRKVATGTESWSVRVGALAIAITPDGQRLATADRDRVITLRETATGAALMTYTGSPMQTAALAFSPDGRRLASCDDLAVRVWDVETTKELLILPTEFGTALDLAWEGDSIFTLGMELRIWSAGAAGREAPSSPP
jgi:WD40 repeat protein